MCLLWQSMVLFVNQLLNNMELFPFLPFRTWDITKSYALLFERNGERDQRENKKRSKQAFSPYYIVRIWWRFKNIYSWRTGCSFYCRTKWGFPFYFSCYLGYGDMGMLLVGNIWRGVRPCLAKKKNWFAPLASIYVVVQIFSTNNVVLILCWYMWCNFHINDQKIIKNHRIWQSKYSWSSY